MVDVARYALLIYGSMLIVGGFIGFRAGSTTSLVMALIFGTMAIASFLASFRLPAAGLAFGALTALVVGGVFVARYLETRAFMPAGFTLTLSVITIVLTVAGLLAARR